MSRTIRHAFSSDIHWDADLEPGIMVVHGFGLAISYAARARHGCILFQNVTLGYGPDPVTKEAGAPLLEKNVHVGIGATLYGPIVVGEATKIMRRLRAVSKCPAAIDCRAAGPPVRRRATRPPGLVYDAISHETLASHRSQRGARWLFVDGVRPVR